MNRLTRNDSISLATSLCKKMVLDLEAGDTSSLDSVSALLEELPLEAVMVAAKREIGLDNIVKHNLDEHPRFGKLMLQASEKFSHFSGVSADDILIQLNKEEVPAAVESTPTI